MNKEQFRSQQLSQPAHVRQQALVGAGVFEGDEDSLVHRVQPISRVTQSVRPT